MNTIATIFFLTSLLVSGHSKSVDSQASPSDLDAALAFIKCTQEAIITGIPEANIPSHNPLIFSQNITFNTTLGDSSIVVHLDNMRMDGIPWWNVTKATQEEADDPDVDIFKFTIYWAMMSLSIDWSYETESPDEEGDSGTLYIELDHVNFNLGWTSTKPKSGKDGTLDDFSIQITTEEAEVDVTNLGVIGDVINVLGGPALAYYVNHLPPSSETNEQLKARITDEWIDKPERIDAINANCNQ